MSPKFCLFKLDFRHVRIFIVFSLSLSLFLPLYLWLQPERSTSPAPPPIFFFMFIVFFYLCVSYRYVFATFLLLQAGRLAARYFSCNRLYLGRKIIIFIASFIAWRDPDKLWLDTLIVPYFCSNYLVNFCMFFCYEISLIGDVYTRYRSYFFITSKVTNTHNLPSSLTKH